ncbi:unnamed protein product [Brachionus calyciflorus]|uniref:SWIM-type domain-containing protein n=1 Tax=Brachionus calyciflorus TaxID=104777 RepID=A0A814A9N0_9BILA|nr:unnamed protein product [Brachionus calyciflorus]
MIDFDRDTTFSDDEDVVLPIHLSSKDLAKELDKQLDKDCLIKRQRRRVYWGLEEIFKNYQDAVKATCSKWTQTKTHPTKKGYKQYYKCSINQKCPAKMHLHILNDCLEVKLYRDQEEHKHDIILNDKRLRKEIKEKIIELYELRVTQPLSIIYSLRKQGFTNVPVPKHITNFLSRTKKKLKGETTISFSEFLDFCRQNNSVPDDKKDLLFLLELASINGSFGCIDATYQLVYQGHPVIVAGHVDKDRSFHPICLALTTKENNKDYNFVMSSIKEKIEEVFKVKYEPLFYLADAADSIFHANENAYPKARRLVCWAHWDPNNLVDQEPKITDLEETKFLRYFKREWVVSKHSLWYEGAGLTYPSTNNGLESYNKDEDLYLVSDNCINVESFDLAYETIVCEREGCECYKKNFDFDQFIQLNSFIKRVKLNKIKWIFSTCICKDYLKLYICEHIICVAVKLKLTKIDNGFNNIGMKNKRGRKPQAKEWFVRH